MDRHHHNPPSHHQPSSPPPQHATAVHHVSHQTTHHQPSSPPPPQYATEVHHVSHQTTHHQPSPPQSQHATAGHHVSHQTTTHHTPKFTDNKPTVRFYCKAKHDYSLTIRDGKPVLAPTNPSDPHQHWIREEKYSTRVKDKEGFPSFALVNKATGQAIKHSSGAEHPVQLVEYDPDKLDESVLWTQSKDLGDGFHAVRMVNNIQLNVDAWHGDKDHGGVRDGTQIYLYKWTEGDNQRWTTAPF